ncbi:MAG: PEP-CTERM sorting domain-containing protein [Acidobacteria bacterium]|nr:PEP-CTERM sorting domain-containing protein [Acidobacteriota bacterium]
MNYQVRRVRRGSRQRRRVRRVAMVGITLASLLLAGAALHRFRSHSSSTLSNPVNSTWTRGNTSDQLAALASSTAVASVPAPAEKHPVYPYSIVPGGAHSVNELQAATRRDPVVARHYADFNFQNAHVSVVTQPRLVYLSYRVGNKVYWSRKRIALRKGEKVLTDGKTVARTRCANQISESPKGETLPAEPNLESLEQPVGDGSATPVPFPGNFESALLRPPADGLVAGLPPGSTGTGFFGGPGGSQGFPPIAPPRIPPRSCTPNHPCPPPPPPPVPEPGTLVLVTSGIAGIYWRYRKGLKK